jgi:hypothetical protein
MDPEAQAQQFTICCARAKYPAGIVSTRPKFGIGMLALLYSCALRENMRLTRNGV